MHLFLSPHADDAPLSCGGTIHALTQQGEPVAYLTVMCGDPQGVVPDTPIIRDLHTRWALGDDVTGRRRAEDSAAGQVLGARVLHTPILDCIYRVHQGAALYPDDVFGEVHPDDDALDTLLSLGLPDGVTHLYVPLAVGGHVDHQIVRAAGLRFMQRHPELPVLFFEDYPYAEAAGALETALASMPAPCAPLLRPLTEADMRAKLAAIRCYESQISTFWQRDDDLDAGVRAFMTQTGAGQPAERFWHMGETQA